jgi:hypothetical protein
MNTQYDKPQNKLEADQATLAVFLIVTNRLRFARLSPNKLEFLRKRFWFNNLTDSRFSTTGGRFCGARIAGRARIDEQQKTGRTMNDSLLEIFSVVTETHIMPEPTPADLPLIRVRTQPGPQPSN